MRVLFLIFISISLLACKQQKNMEQSSLIHASDSIELSRSACFGTCPVYSVQVFADGRVLYEGQRNVQNLGKFSANLEEAEAKLFFEELSQLNWTAYPESYPIDNVDFPQFKLVYQNQELQKTIKANSNAAPELIELAKQIDFMLTKLEYTPI
ncbi:MAG: hypothetical protein KDC82_00810 [Bacteroidetes bacterium]|nr:hypothetical protein [Bacteroidota bacterium]